MSGGKRTYVSVEQTEWQRIMQKAQQLREVQANLPEMLESLRRQSADEVRRQFQPLEQRQRVYEQALAQASDEMRRLEADTAKGLAKQRTQMQRELESMAGQFRSETHELMQQQERKLTQLVEQERNERRRQIEAQERRIDRIEDDQNRHRAYASLLIRDAQVKAHAIRVGRAHHQFRPGELERLEDTIRRIETELNSLNNPQTAIASAHMALDELEVLNLDLQRLETEWRTWRAVSLEAGRAILAIAAQNRQVKVKDLQGETIDVAVEADHWTEGKLSALEQRVNALVAAVGDDAHPISTNDLRQMTEREFPALRMELDKIIEEAQVNVLSSQMRISLADEVVLALEHRGYVVQASTYEGEDQRDGYVAKVQNIAGSEVVIHVKPVAGRPGQNELTISSYPDNRPEWELRQQAREIAQVLRTSGLQLPEQMEETGRPDEIGRDPNQWRQRKQQRQTS